MLPHKDSKNGSKLDIKVDQIGLYAQSELEVHRKF